MLQIHYNMENQKIKFFTHIFIDFSHEISGKIRKNCQIQKNGILKSDQNAVSQSKDQRCRAAQAIVK